MVIPDWAFTRWQSNPVQDFESDKEDGPLHGAMLVANSLAKAYSSLKCDGYNRFWQSQAESEIITSKYCCHEWKIAHVGNFRNQLLQTMTKY